MTTILALKTLGGRTVWVPRLLLLAAFSSFSFNNLPLTQYYFLAGQAAFFFLVVALLVGVQGARNSTIFFAIGFSAYLLSSALLVCSTGGACTSRPLTGVVTVLFVIAVMELVATVAEREVGLEVKIERALIGAAWMVVVFAVPDIIAIQTGDIQASILEPSLLRYSPEPYTAPRLRGFTQEPSYLGMVIATLYPFVLMRIERRVSAMSILLLMGLWLCLLFSMSKTGLATCLAFTVIWGVSRVRSFFLLLVFGAAFLCVAIFVIGTDTLMNSNYAYIDQWRRDGVDISTLTRVGHMVAALNLWLDNLLLGAGLGQSGYFLPDFYPEWIWESPEAPMWAAAAAEGGVPTFSFLPKLLAEIGLIGAVFLLIKAWPLLRTVRKNWANEYYLRAFASSMICFLIASFGVEGWQYMAAWLAFGVLVGLGRRLESAASAARDGSHA